MDNKLKVLIVDDSILFREVLSIGISSDPHIEVVGTASDPYDAVDKIIKYKPDVLTCDIEMPKMNGIEFIRQLMPQYPLPVVVVSTVSDAVFRALNAGAVDFITKPNINSASELELFVKELISKIKVASIAEVLSNTEEVLNVDSIKDTRETNVDLIAIGASTGGTEAIYQILNDLPKDIPGIVIVQHIPPVFSKMFADRLNATTGFKVKEAESGDVIEPNHVFVAPGNSHIRIKKVGSLYKISCVKGNKVNGHCPSVDVLFESVANECNKNAIGVILTGMGYDGAKGLLSMRKSGSYTIGQDEQSSVVYGMPRVAYNIGAVLKQVPLHRVSKAILTALSQYM